MSIPIHRSSYLVLGTGVAGLTFALRAAKYGTVNLVTKKEVFESNTNYAQGGIAAVFDNSDSFEAHIQDTYDAGAGLCHLDAVRTIVENGPEMIRELIAYGTKFTLDEKGTLDLGREGGHSFRRIVHAQDLTGREVEKTLVNRIQASENIHIFEHHLAADLIVEDDPKRCWGAWVWDAKQNQLVGFVAGATVICTGGCSRVYRHSTNPSTTTGDGIAMAFRQNARVANMEFIQFHPTAYYTTSDERPFLISEAVRGEGGILRTGDGTAFMEKHHPLKDLAPRDIVARAIDSEMKRTGDVNCSLDVSHLDQEFLKKRFPAITNYCMEHGLDLSKDCIPVVPAAHYLCGGVVTDANAETDIPGLFASGEVAFTGVHGANRLASNSILEALVFSRFSVETTVESGIIHEQPKRDPIAPWSEIKTGALEAVRIVSSSRMVRNIMWDYVGIVRSTERLKRALNRMWLIKEEMDTYISQGYMDAPLIELRNLTQVAELIILSALNRKESRGLHYNIDYPDPLKEMLDTFLTLKPNGVIDMQSIPIPE